ncbi:hypothetical protein [Amycolatopsis sp. cmx-4-68]|uniref:hypothetical protein n=1 Tax=Amycolatopsis sp. cmx-4-68 TaxID=2790938 RepID=UPI00397C5915
MTTTIALSFAYVAALALLPEVAAAAAAPACHVHTLPEPPGAVESEVTAGDPSGEFLVGTANGPDDSPADVMWGGGRPVVIPRHGVAQRLNAVNIHGAAVGSYVEEAGGAEFGFVYQDGQSTKLEPLRAGESVVPLAINTRGDVVGTEFATASSRTVAVLWPAGGISAPRELPVPGLNPAIPAGIDDDGTVILGDTSEGEIGHAFVWRDGQASEMLSPEGKPTSVAAIRGGWVAGQSRTGPADDAVGVRWQLATGRAELIPPFWKPTAVNNSGTVALVRPSNQSVLAKADETTVRLPGLQAGSTTEAHAVANNGTAAGWAAVGSRGYAVEWTGC